MSDRFETERIESRGNYVMRRFATFVVADTDGNTYRAVVEVGRGNFLAYGGGGDNRRTFADVYAALDYAHLLCRDALEYYNAQGTLLMYGEDIQK